MKNELNIKKMIWNENEQTSLEFYFLPHDEVEFPLCGVGFSNGLFVKCGFAMHATAFSVGAAIILATNFKNEENLILYPDTESGINTKKLYDELALMIDENGVVNQENSPMFAYLMEINKFLDSPFAKGKYNETVNIINSASFMGANTGKPKQNSYIEDVAKKWINEHKKEIQLIRQLIYALTDSDFWVANNEHEWRKYIYKNFKLNVNLSKYTSPYRYKNPIAWYTTLIDDIHEIGCNCDKYNYNLKYVIEAYPSIRISLGTNASYASLWADNFTTEDLDDLIYKEDYVLSTNQNLMKKFSKEKDGIVNIYDKMFNISFKLERKDISLIYIHPEKNIVYITFIAPIDLTLISKTYYKGEIVPNFVIDESTTIEIV